MIVLNKDLLGFQSYDILLFSSNIQKPFHERINLNSVGQLIPSNVLGLIMQRTFFTAHNPIVYYYKSHWDRKVAIVVVMLIVKANLLINKNE